MRWDVVYVEELIGPDTVNTLPVATLEAFRDHGKLRSSITENVDEAAAVIAELAGLGIDIDAVTAELQVEGVAAFAASFDQLLAALDAARSG
jgi:transaldolase